MKWLLCMLIVFIPLGTVHAEGPSTIPIETIGRPYGKELFSLWKRSDGRYYLCWGTISPISGLGKSLTLKEVTYTKIIHIRARDSYDASLLARKYLQNHK